MKKTILIEFQAIKTISKKQQKNNLPTEYIPGIN